MSNIETYKAAKAIAERLAIDADRCLGRDMTVSRHWAVADFREIGNEHPRPMLIGIELSHGYYGKYTAYTSTASDMGRYLAKAITQHIPALLDAAVALAKADAEAARKDAEAEARAVLEGGAA